jgi:hypothetical protein
MKEIYTHPIKTPQNGFTGGLRGRAAGFLNLVWKKAAFEGLAAVPPAAHVSGGG